MMWAKLNCWPSADLDLVQAGPDIERHQVGARRGTPRSGVGSETVLIWLEAAGQSRAEVDNHAPQGKIHPEGEQAAPTDPIKPRRLVEGLLRNGMVAVSNDDLHLRFLSRDGSMVFFPHPN